MAAKAGSKLLRKQAINRRVLVALIPPAFAGVYFFGWRSLAMIVVSGVVAFLIEFWSCRSRREPVSEAVFVTSTIYALIMPPTVPWHVLIIGVAFAIGVVKELFGGFGRNFFNPAMAGRCFVYVCFPVALTATWAPVAEGRLGALGMWSTAGQVEAVASATPMAFVKSGQLIPVPAEEAQVDVMPYSVPEGETILVDRGSFLRTQFIGRLSGTMGVNSVLLVLVGGLYLFWTGTANRILVISTIVTYFGWMHGLHLAGVSGFYGGQYPLLGGGFLFGAFFMVTDPISAPKTDAGKVIYGFIIGTSTMVIRTWSIFNGGLMFSLLLANTFAPIIDYGVKAWQDRRVAAAVPASGGEPA